METLLTIDDISKTLKVSIKTLRNWCYRAKIPYVKVNGCVRFRVSDINAWLGHARQMA